MKLCRNSETKYGTVQLSIPRDRNGNFSPAYGRRDDHWEEMVIKLYQTGVTTREICIIEQCMVITIVLPISNISKATQENVATFHEQEKPITLFYFLTEPIFLKTWNR